MTILKNILVSILSLFIIKQTGLCADFGCAFLLLPTNARESALSNSLTTIASGIESLNSNPALLSNVKLNEIGFTGSLLFDGRDYSTISWSRPFERGGFGLEVIYLDLGDVEKTNLSSGLAGITSGKAQANDLGFQFGYGFKWLYGLSLGGSMKFFSEKLDNERASSVNINAGLLYTTPVENLLLGATLKNIGRRIHFEDIKEKQPLALDLGASYTFLNNNLTIAADLVKNRSEEFSAQLGFEARVMDKIFLRLGFDSKNEAKENISVGFGVDIDAFRVDYSIVPEDEFSSEHFLTLRYNFSLPEPEKPIPKYTLQYYLSRAKKRIHRGWYKLALKDVIRAMDINPMNDEALNLSIRLRKVIKIMEHR
ncbi:MAG: PorV/PorQ family protein [Candidatus Hydrogenedentota bacterium]